MTHSALAFELEGGWRDTKGAVTATVLQYLLGGGGSFSSGGPGRTKPYLTLHVLLPVVSTSLCRTHSMMYRLTLLLRSWD